MRYNLLGLYIRFIITSLGLKLSPKNHERCFVNLNAKPVQIMKSCFTVVVHGEMLREKNTVKSKMRKAFYNKTFCPPKKKINSSLLLV